VVRKPAAVALAGWPAVREVGGPRRQAPSAPTLESWAQPSFLAAVAETHLRRVLIPAMVATWTKKARGEPAERVDVSDPVKEPPQ
jgi:hypothetical protein